MAEEHVGGRDSQRAVPRLLPVLPAHPRGRGPREHLRLGGRRRDRRQGRPEGFCDCGAARRHRRDGQGAVLRELQLGEHGRLLQRTRHGGHLVRQGRQEERRQRGLPLRTLQRVRRALSVPDQGRHQGLPLQGDAQQARVPLHERPDDGCLPELLDGPLRRLDVRNRHERRQLQLARPLRPRLNDRLLAHHVHHGQQRLQLQEPLRLHGPRRQDVHGTRVGFRLGLRQPAGAQVGYERRRAGLPQGPVADRLGAWRQRREFHGRMVQQPLLLHEAARKVPHVPSAPDRASGGRWTLRPARRLHPRIGHREREPLVLPRGLQRSHGRRRRLQAVPEGPRSMA